MFLTNKGEISVRALLLCLFVTPFTFAEDFTACIDGLKQRAGFEGIEPNLIALLDTVEPIERVIELDRSQPEYTQTFADYVYRRVTTAHVRRGRELMKEHSELLKSLQVQYGIPPQYIVAFWGLETNFGSYLGKMPILNSLATLACDQRRAEQFTRELLIALKLVGKHQLELDYFVGSWAGAMGHTQFMPSAYDRYGIDGDGDGRVDLWNSIPDALTSAAHFLQSLGWDREYRWGREVIVPDDFDYYQTGLEQKRKLGEWRNLEIRRIDGKKISGVSNIDAAMIVPAGAEGPKFLVYHNFNVIRRWNTPMFYGLAVGHMADRVNGAGDFHQPPSKDPGTRVETVLAIQELLNSHGFDVGNADGRPGPATQKGAREFQQRIQVTADGYSDEELLKQLQEYKGQN